MKTDNPGFVVLLGPETAFQECQWVREAVQLEEYPKVGSPGKRVIITHF